MIAGAAHAGSIFDNVLVTDDVKYAAKFAEQTFLHRKDSEKDMFEKLQKEKEAEEEEKRKKVGPSGIITRETRAVFLGQPSRLLAL